MGFSALALTLSWGRPWAGAFLILPLLLLIASRKGTVDLAAPLSTLDLMRKSAPAALGEVRTARPPRSTLLLALALALAALGLCGPRLGAGGPREAAFDAIVDRSPSMYLPYAEPASGVPGVERSPVALTRMDVALLELERWSERSGAALRWWTASGAAIVPCERDELSIAPRAAQKEPDWTRFDRDDAIWVTDGSSSMSPPLRAGLFASGGGAVAGPVARVASGETLIYDGSSRVERSTELSPPVVRVDSALPLRLRKFVELWCKTHALALEPVEHTRETSPEQAAVVLSVLRSCEESGAFRFEAGRDGWSIRGRACSVSVAAPAEEMLGPWLTSEHQGRPVALISAAPGRVEVAIEEIEEESGDPAAFAVSLGGLLDQSLLVPVEIVPLDERLEAGSDARIEPRGAALPGSGEEPRELAPALALAAFLLASLWFFVEPAFTRR